MTELEVLILSGNDLVSPIPSSLGNLAQLSFELIDLVTESRRVFKSQLRHQRID